MSDKPKENPEAPRSMMSWLFTEEQVKAEVERAVRAFAEYLGTTASPKGTVQREKLQGFATEFLAEASNV